MRTRLRWRRYRLPLRDAAFAGGLREGFSIEVEIDGVRGRGEVAPAYWIDDTDLDAVESELRSVEALDLPWQPNEVLPWLDTAMLSPAVRCGLESALVEAHATAAGRSVCEWLGGPASAVLSVNALATERAPDALAERARQWADDGFQIAKIKVGSADPNLDRSRVAALLNGSDRRLRLRLDLNQSGTVAAIESICRDVPRASIDHIEEPLRDPTPEAIAEIERTTGIAIALDETLTDLADLGRWGGSCSVAVLKLARVGGPRLALRMTDEARRHSMRVVFTDSIESTVGRALTAHVAAAAGAVDAIGLGGLALLAEDHGGGRPVERPTVNVGAPGLGS